MVELGYCFVEEVDENLAVPTAGGLEGIDGAGKVVDFCVVGGGAVFDDADGAVAVEVEDFARGVELFEVFFAGGVARKEVDGPFADFFEFVDACAGFVFACAFDGLVAKIAEVADGYVAEGDLVELFVEFGEEEVAVFAEEAREEAQFSRFFGGNEVALYVVGGGEGLVLFHTPVEAVEEAAVGKGDVGEAGGGYGLFEAAPHEVVRKAGRAPPCGRVGLYAPSPRYRPLRVRPLRAFRCDPSRGIYIRKNIRKVSIIDSRSTCCI